MAGHKRIKQTTAKSLSVRLPGPEISGGKVQLGDCSITAPFPPMRRPTRTALEQNRAVAAPRSPRQ